MRVEHGLAAFGVEFQAEKILDARLPDLRGTVLRGDLGQLGLRDHQFDAALVNEVLEHVPSEHRALVEIRRVLRPGGTLVVMSPNRLYPFESHGVMLRGSHKAVPLFVPFIPYLPLALGRRLFMYRARNYWPCELQAIVEDAGYSVVTTGFVWQTFEDISRQQPRLLRTARPALQAVSNRLERTPFLRRFGVSQLVVATA